MQPSFYFSLIFAAALLASVAFNFWLTSRQVRYVTEHRDAVPAPFAATVGLAEHQRAADYTVAKARFSVLTTAAAATTVLGWTLLGGLHALNRWLLESAEPHTGPIGYQLTLLAAFALISGLIDLPFGIYRTFGLEQRFGFNHTTPKLYVLDLAKSLCLSALIGLPLAALVLWLMAATGSWWWLWAWSVWIVFNLLALLLYPTWIAPLFNRFEPLADDSLRERVERLLTRSGFAAKGLFVMDGSKRSAHANAYFTGFGAAKRVVFFDTLLQKLSPGEVEAVLAHELGHFKYRHVLKRITSMFVLSGLGFALLGWLAHQAWFYIGLGVTPAIDAPNDALALLLFMLVIPAFMFFLSPVFAGWSRRHEFEADAYACSQTRGDDLRSALLKLHQDNATTLTPDPAYVRFFYSHPPAIERLAALVPSALAP